MKNYVIAVILLTSMAFGQQPDTYQIRTVAFYNVENLFDTTNDSLVRDDERTPTGAYRWTKGRYHTKIAHISRVLSELGADATHSAPDIIGLCEVEQLQVVRDLIAHPHLADKEYGIVHFDSPDERGIDVAFLYKKSVFLPTSFKSLRLLLFDVDGYRDYTRDQLLVGGLLDGEPCYFLVNHWPSRSGGEMRSRPNRIKAAELNKRILDSLRRIDPSVKLISMGDFNDDPRDDSLKKVLRTKGKPKQLDSLSLFNPMEKMYRKGLGTLAYRDRWNLFDQFVLTPNWLQAKDKQYRYWKANIYAPDYLKTKEGRYKGYPFRTYAGTTYLGGYADHFPVYLYLIRKVLPHHSGGG